MVEEELYEVEQEPQPDPIPKKLKVKDFAAKIKIKYPEYKDIDDTELTNKIIAKYPEYKDQVDLTPDVKKKEATGQVGGTLSSPTSNNTSSVSETPLLEENKEPIPIVTDYGNGEVINPKDPFAMSKAANDFSKRTIDLGVTGEGTEVSPDEKSVKAAEEITKDLEKQGFKTDFSIAVNDLPEDVFNETPKEELAALYKENPLKFKQLTNELKNRYAIRQGALDIANETIPEGKDKEYLARQQAIIESNEYNINEIAQPETMDEFREMMAIKQNNINKNIANPDTKKKLQERLKDSYASYLNADSLNLREEYESSDMKGLIDINQYAGLETYRIFDPAKYENYKNIIQQKITPLYSAVVNVTPEEQVRINTPDSAFAAKNKGELSPLTISEQVGQETVLRELNAIGLGNAAEQLYSQRSDLIAAQNKMVKESERKDITQEELAILSFQFNESIKKVNGIEAKIGELEKSEKLDDARYPQTAQLKFDAQVKEAAYDDGQSVGAFMWNKFGHSMGSSVDAIETLLVSNFGSKDDKARLSMKRIGQQGIFDAKTYLPENERRINSPVIMQFDEGLEKQIKKVLNGRSLGDLSQTERNQLIELVKNNQDKIKTITNPDAGKSKNFFSKATVMTVAGFTSEIAAFMAKMALLRGAGIGAKTAEAEVLFMDGYNHTVQQKLAEGASMDEANEYGILHGAILSTMVKFGSKFEAVKKIMAGGKSPLSKHIAGMSEETWNAIYNKNKSFIQRAGSSAKGVAGGQVNVIGTFAGIAPTADAIADNVFYNADNTVGQVAETVIEGSIDMAIGGLPLIGFGLAKGSMKHKATPLEKATLWNLGDQPEMGKLKIDEAVTKGDLTKEEGEIRKKTIDEVSKLITKVPTKTDKGKLMNDQQRIDYLFNLAKQENAKQESKDLPPKQAEKADHTAKVADYENQIILDTPTTEKLESRKASIEKKLEQKDEEGKLVLPDNERADYKAELEAVTNELETRKKGVIDTKLSEPIEGLDEQGIPIGDNVPKPTDLTSQLKEKLTNVTVENEADLLSYAIDKVSEAPTKLKEDLGEELFNQVLEKVPTEKLQESLDYLLDKNPDSKDVDVLDKIISQREIKQQSGKDGVVDEGVGKKTTEEMARENNIRFTRDILLPDGSINKAELKTALRRGKPIAIADRQHLDFLKKVNEKLQDKELAETIDYLEYVFDNFTDNVQKLREKSENYDVTKGGTNIKEYRELVKGFNLELDGRKAVMELFEKVFNEIEERFIVKGESPNRTNLLEQSLSTPKAEGKDVEPGVKFPLPKKPVEEMTSVELDNHIAEVKEFQKKTKLPKEQEDALTGKEADEYFGKNLPEGGVYDPVELQRIRNRVSLIEEAETLQDIAATIKRPLIDYAKKKDTENLAVIKAAKRKADELGISTEDFIKSVNEQLKSEFKGDADAISKIVFDAIETKPTLNEGKETKLPDTEKKGSDTASTTDEATSKTESGKEGGKEPPAEPVEGGVFVEDKSTILSHRGLQEVATEFGLTDVTSRETISDLKEFKAAEQTIDGWVEKGKYSENIEKMIDGVVKGEALNFQQRVILQQHIANHRGKTAEIRKSKGIESKEYNEALQELDRLKTAGQIARSTAGAALRVGEIRSNAKPTLEDWMVEKQESSNVFELTSEQKKEVEKDFTEYEEKLKQSDAKLEQAAAEIAKLKAELELQTERSKRSTLRKKNTESLAKERKDIVQSIKDKWRGVGKDNILSSDIPYRKQLAAIAPDVLRLTRNLLDAGTTKLEGIVDNIYEELKGIVKSKKDIHDIIAGEYNEKQKTLTELQAAYKDVREEAKLVNELERLMANEPKEPKKKIERNKRINELRKQIKDFKKEHGKSAEEILVAVKKRNEEQKKKIEEDIKNKKFTTEKRVPFDENLALKKSNPKLWKEAMDAVVAKEEAKNKWELKKRQDELSKRSFGRKVIDFGSKVISTTKVFKAGIDDSVTFVQLGMAVMANPRSGVKAKISAIKDISNKNFKRNLAALHQSKYWHTIEKSGLDITEPKSHLKENVEELYSGNLLDQNLLRNGKNFNIWTNTGGLFERLFTSMGNNLRVNMFMKRIESLEGEGKTFETHPEEYKSAARVINELTGRGKVNEHLQGAMPLVTPIIWAPKMLASSFNLLGIGDLANIPLGKKGLYRSLTPQQRKYAFTQMGKGIGMGVSVMAALSMNGWSVDFDPESDTFGFVKKGTKSYNVFGRYANTVKALVQVVTGRKKTKGNIKDLDEKDGRGSVVGKFFRGKMTPAAGIGYDLWLNRQQNSFSREPITAETLPNDLLTPISIGDLKKGMEQDGTISLLTRFLPAFEGIQVRDDRDFIDQDIKIPEWKFLYDNDLKLVRHKKDTIKPLNEKGEAVKVTDDKYKQFTNEREALVKNEVSTVIKNGVIEWDEGVTKAFKDLTPDEKKSWMMTTTKRATKAAFEKIWGEQPEKENKKWETAQ